MLDQNITVTKFKVYKSIRCGLQQTSVKLTDLFLNSLVQFIQKTVKIFRQNAQDQNLEKQEAFLELGLDEQAPEFAPLVYSTLDWVTQPIQSFREVTYIHEIKIFGLQLEISFKHSQQSHASDHHPNSDKQSTSIIQNAFKALKLSFGNIENAPLNLPPIHLSEQSTTVPNILKQISARYTREGLFSLLRIMGSINIIGNPVGLVVNLGTGIWDLIDKPMTGFVKGPIEGTFGLFKGAASLLRHSVQGVFNSVESFSDSVASGLSHISLDSVYVAQRGRIKQQHPENLLTGVGYGSLALVLGIQKGLTGIVTIPYRDALRHGPPGAFKGLLKGKRLIDG